MPDKKPIHGIIPAVLLPRHTEGGVAWATFGHYIEFLNLQAIAGVCVNGATGEYTAASPGERAEAVRRARAICGPRRVVVSGVGGSSLREVVEHAHCAVAAGADAVLLPAPHFFKYSAGDLAAYFEQAATQINAPVILYNLAAFAAPVPCELTLRLTATVPNVVGIKDSSGSLETLEALRARPQPTQVRFVGHDGVLSEGLERGLANGAISGVAGVLPELTVSLYEAWKAGDHERFGELSRRQRELLDSIEAWPVPWALKLIAEFRGFGAAEFALPLSAERQAQARAFRTMFEAWWREFHKTLESTTPESAIVHS